ncbi:MAG: alpha-L-rhamnosidase [Spirochaetes bacterium]|nr:alpha-L-rhamnosidase [Spirochaetota bacterium]
MNATIAKDHPLRKAVWIWPQGYMYLYNHYAHFRKDFDLAVVPAKAPLFITADKAYKLYVNGTYICRGPARGYQSHWPFDEIDAAPYLKTGHNWIAVEAYNPGISTFQYLHQTSAGMLCAAEWGDVKLYSNQQWLMRRSPAHKRETARYSLQIDFQEHVDAREDDRSWITSATPPTGWRAEIFPDGGQQFLSAPFGRPPYTSVEERGIPLMRETVMIPDRIGAHISGTCGERYREWKNVSWGFVREVLGASWDNGSGVTGKKTDEGFTVTMESAGEGKFNAVSLIMPKYAVGNVILTAQNARGGEIIDLQFHECMVNERPAIHEPGRGCVAAMANRIVLREGTTAHEFYHHLGFTVVTIIGRDITSPVTLTVAVRNVGYPFTMRGVFECSDAALNSIHAISRHTQQICALDSYVDTPWREQAQWWGDARVQAKNTFFIDGDARLLRRGIRSIAGQRTDDGLTYGHAPTSAHNCILPDFALTWILTIWDYYYQTGDISLFTEQYSRIKEVLGYFDIPEARHETGLLRYDRRLWLFEDWSTLYKGEIPTFLNLWYIVAMRSLADMSAAAKMSDEAKHYARIVQTHEQLAVENLFDASQQLFIGGLDDNLAQVKESSVHDQTLALMLGICPKAHETMLQKKILPFLRDEKTEGPVPSAFWVTYVFEEAGKRGYGADVIEFIRRKWSPMIQTGTTWEGYDWSDGKGGGTVSHAWTAHPSFHFVNILAGVSQTAAAWEKVHFAPTFIPGIQQVKTLIPTPKGDITASWERNTGGITVRLAVPAGVNAEGMIGGRAVHVTGPDSLELMVNA